MFVGQFFGRSVIFFQGTGGGGRVHFHVPIRELVYIQILDCSNTLTDPLICDEPFMPISTGREKREETAIPRTLVAKLRTKGLYHQRI